MGLWYRIKRKIIYSSYYIIDLFEKSKRAVDMIENHKRAIIGCNFNTLKYDLRAGKNFRIYNEGKRENIIIGDNVFIDGFLSCNSEGRIEVGDYTSINHNTFIAADELVKIGKYCFIARDVLIQDNNSHPIDPHERKKQALSYNDEPSDTYESKNGPIEIDDNVWIGAKAIILKNVTIGYGSIIAAGAVVTKSVPPMSIAAGNPARVVKTITDSIML